MTRNDKSHIMTLCKSLPQILDQRRRPREDIGWKHTTGNQDTHFMKSTGQPSEVMPHHRRCRPLNGQPLGTTTSPPLDSLSPRELRAIFFRSLDTITASAAIKRFRHVIGLASETPLTVPEPSSLPVRSTHKRPKMLHICCRRPKNTISGAIHRSFHLMRGSASIYSGRFARSKRMTSPV
jgi:hypothetical protein